MVHHVWILGRRLSGDSLSAIFFVGGVSVHVACRGRQQGWLGALQGEAESQVRQGWWWGVADRVWLGLGWVGGQSGPGLETGWLAGLD